MIHSYDVGSPPSYPEGQSLFTILYNTRSTDLNKVIKFKSLKKEKKSLVSIFPVINHTEGV